MEANIQDNPDHTINKDSLPRPLVLVIIDSLGIAPKNSGNAFTDIKTKNISELVKKYPIALLTSDFKTVAERYQSLGAAGLLSKSLASVGLSQLNLTESEKLISAWHHFHGGRDKLLTNEELKVVSSKTGDRLDDPEQVLSNIIKLAISDIKKGLHDFIVVSLANLDLVSARGKLELTQEAAKILDKNLGRLVSVVLKNKGLLIVTAAYGHAEEMINVATDLPQKGISNNPIPFIIVGKQFEGRTIGLPDALDSDLSLVEPSGTLADVAPTILKILNIPQPEEMLGESLI